MNNPIQSYDQLLIRKKQLESLLQAQGELIRIDVEEIKESLAPLHEAVTGAVNFFTQDKAAGLLGFGANRMFDVLLRKIVLSKSSWLTKLIVPFFVKNVSSHFIAEHKDQWMDRIRKWFSSNGHHKEQSEKESEYD